MNTQIVIVLAIGVFAITVFIGVCLVVIARLRRKIKTQFETVENLLKTVQASQGRDEPGDPS
ncbi:MAG TPA: hypothetical protein VJS67_06245 [Pseudonocardiaceae bacterium]|nr:hypothetical protein [Pseudonocardiaceae bacterium]